MAPRSTNGTETIQACLIGVAFLLVGLGLMVGDIVIPRSLFGGSLLILAGVCYLVSVFLRLQRRSRQHKKTDA
ncbi:hypothetical protein F7P69_14115 [Cellulosimicrobium funkei]|nr:hypothetical protein [Cellulosimicrobium funkei]